MDKSTDVLPERNLFGLYRAGGVSALALGILYGVITVLYMVTGALPSGSGAEGWLKHIAGYPNEWWAILGVSVLTDFLFLPVAWALFNLLKKAGINMMLAGASLLVLFVVLDLAVTWPNYASLIQFGGQYAAAAGGLQQKEIVTSAAYAYEVLSSRLFGVYTILTPAIGIFLIGIAMLKGAFGKVTAYFGIGTGVFGLVSVAGPFFVPALSFAAVITSVLTLVWLVLAGIKLIKLGKPNNA